MTANRLLLRRLAALAAAVALVVGSGAHWVALQSVAWVGMVAAFVQDRPLAEAVADTLDGQHPCALCSAIAEAKKGETNRPDGKAPPGQKAAKKLWACPEKTGISCLWPPAVMAFVTPTSSTGAARREAPLVPPPRQG